MSNIPSYIRNFLDQFAQSDSLAGTPGFKVMCALRRKLLATNADLSPEHPHFLTMAQVEQMSTRVTLEISCVLDETDVDYLAERLAQSYLQVRDAFAESGYQDPVSAALDVMKQFSVKF